MNWTVFAFIALIVHFAVWFSILYRPWRFNRKPNIAARIRERLKIPASVEITVLSRRFRVGVVGEVKIGDNVFDYSSYMTGGTYVKRKDGSMVVSIYDDWRHVTDPLKDFKWTSY